MARKEPFRTGSGEAAPLPGFSPDTLSDCERALGALDHEEQSACTHFVLNREAPTASWDIPSACAHDRHVMPLNPQSIDLTIRSS
jgi:O-succinylbenzoate synthase